MATLMEQEHRIFGTSPEVEPKTNANSARPYQRQPYKPVALSSFIKTSFGLFGKPQWNRFATRTCMQAGQSKERLLQAQPNPRQMGAGNLHTSLQALSDSDRACISQCRTAHRSALLLDRVCMFTPGIPAQHTWRALHVRMEDNNNNNKLVTWSYSK